jgi:YVTN family beta-propeller protein
LAVPPAAAGIGITDGKTLIVADYYNDALSFATLKSGVWTKTSELDLRPGKIDPANSGIPGGEYPYWVSVKGHTTVYVSSIRDREIDVVDISSTPTVAARIKVKGQPNKMVLNSAQSTLYVAEDETDTVDVIDTVTNKITATILVGMPAGLSAHEKYTGHNTNSVTLSPDEKTLYVTNANSNDVAVVRLSSRAGSPATVGLIHTGWYPTSVSFNSDGSYMYVINFKFKCLNIFKKQIGPHVGSSGIR